MEKKILFVDDNEELLTLMTGVLKDAGYIVLMARDPTEAMVQAEGQLLGLILLDINLKGESGVMLMKFLRRNHPEVPIILYTGEEHTEEQVVKMLEQGAHQYVKKGSPEQLISAVRRSFR